MRFTKMQATGNDFICVCTLEKPLPELATNAKALCNRRFGIGADGLLEIGRSQSADFSMRLWNADGSEAEMCGNGIRCLGKYVYDRGYARETCFSVETRAGVRTVEIQEGNDCTAEWIRVGMGVPEWSKLPLRWEKLSEIENWTGKQVGNELFPVSMGNPHCVVLFSEGETVPIQWGKRIEVHEAFPERTNVELATMKTDGTVLVRVWERGVGETLACGTGACAAAVAMIRARKAKTRELTVKMPGGSVRIEQNPETEFVYLKGSASFVCEGVTL